MKRRVKKKAKRKLKLWVKGTILAFFLIVIGALTGYYLYQESLKAIDPTGSVEEVELPEEIYEQGEIQDMSEEDTQRESMEYTVIESGDLESILIDCNETEVLIDTGDINKTLSYIKGKIDGPLDYLIITNDSRNKDIDKLESVYKISNVVGVDIKGANTISPGSDIILGDRFSLSTIAVDGEVSLVTFVRYGDCTFLALSDLGEDGEKEIKDIVGSPDVIVASQHGLSQNNNIIRNNGARFITVSSSDVSKVGESLLKDSQNTPVYITGKVGDLTFTCSGDIVAAQFNSDLYVTSEGLAEEESVSEDGLSENVISGEDVGSEPHDSDEKTAELPNSSEDVVENEETENNT